MGGNTITYLMIGWSMEKSHRPRQMALIHPKAFKLGGVQIGLIQQTKRKPRCQGVPGLFYAYSLL
jgi:hypothetical protein